MIAIYNNSVLEDTLIVYLKNTPYNKQDSERKGDIAVMRDLRDGKPAGINFFNVSQWTTFETEGGQDLSLAQIDALNLALTEAGFDLALEVDNEPKFVVGHVLQCDPMPDSNHLSITQTQVDKDQILQIVCGAPNIDVEQKVVVAKDGALMPDGSIIWAGELRGTPSEGMICSAKELGLTEKAGRGILVLDEDAEVGSAFQF